jgi:hypothetical protein
MNKKPIKHKLKECTMMKNYMTTGNLAMNKKPEGDSTWMAATPFLEEKVVMLIYGGPGPREACRKLSLIGQVIDSMSVAVLEYLCWPESPITFDRMDHPNIIPKPGWFPLIVDPLVGTT